MKKKTYYLLADLHPDYRPIGQYRAVLTGEVRPPRAGEWYLSGTIPEAYFTRVDISMNFHICKLVRVKVSITEVK